MTHDLDQVLLEADATLLVGTIWNPAGLILAKTVPIARAERFVSPGLGASPTWNAFTIDRGGIAFTSAMGTVGDHRLRIDRSAVRVFDDGLAWAPADVVTQDGEPVAECTRGALRRIEERLADAGLTARVGHELEFILFDEAGERLPAGTWAPYSLAAFAEFEDFVRDVYAAAEEVGLEIEQVHAEYGEHQFELVLSPDTPVRAADAVVLARLIIGRAARASGLTASFSPKPLADSAGNGAHQHFSIARDGASLLAGGDGPHGLSADGGSAIAGIVAALPGIQAALAGSILSTSRLQPGTWAGAHAAWGLENREVAARLIAGSNDSANVEVKIIDPSTSAYIASAAVLGAALAGIESGAELPAEATSDPGALSDAERAAAGIAVLTSDHGTAIEALRGSDLARGILGDGLVEAIVAVRDYERKTYGSDESGTNIERFRLSWSQ